MGHTRVTADRLCAHTTPAAATFDGADFVLLAGGRSSIGPFGLLGVGSVNFKRPFQRQSGQTLASQTQIRLGQVAHDLRIVRVQPQGLHAQIQRPLVFPLGSQHPGFGAHQHRVGRPLGQRGIQHRERLTGLIAAQVQNGHQHRSP